MNDRKLFYEWLAGQLDGDGHFSLDLKNNRCVVTITTHTLDLKMFQYIQETLGIGRIRHRPKFNCYVYGIYTRSQVIDLLNNLNGLIYNSVKFKSFSKMCVHLGIVPIKATIPDRSSAYYAGYFDADGTTGVYLNKRGYPNIIISLKNKFKMDVLPLKTTFGGNVYNCSGLSYAWSIGGRADILAFVKYAQLGYFQSFKSTKFLLIEEYFLLRELRAWHPTSIHHDRWVIHYAKWCRKGYDDK